MAGTVVFPILRWGNVAGDIASRCRFIARGVPGDQRDDDDYRTYPYQEIVILSISPSASAHLDSNLCITE